MSEPLDVQANRAWAALRKADMKLRALEGKGLGGLHRGFIDHQEKKIAACMEELVQYGEGSDVTSILRDLATATADKERLEAELTAAHDAVKNATADYEMAFRALVDDAKRRYREQNEPSDDPDEFSIEAVN